MKSFMRSIGYCVALLICTYFLWVTFQKIQTHDLSSLASGRTIAAMILAACFYVSIIPISSIAWSGLLSRQGEIWSIGPLVLIMSITQIAKYIPGGIAQPAGRAAMSLNRGMQLRAFTVTVIQESVLAVAASVFIGLSLLSLLPNGIANIPVVYHGWMLLTALLSAAIPLFFAIGPNLLRQVALNWQWISRTLVKIGPLPGIKITLVAFVAYCVNYLLIGVGVWLIAASLEFGSNAGYMVLTATFTLAWLAGFIIPGAPAGLGVREGVMTLLLSGAVPQHQILPLVIATRLATILGDSLSLSFGCLLLACRMARRRRDQ